MRVVVIEGGNRRGDGDDIHLRALSSMVDLTVYGHREGADHRPPFRPEYCESRLLRPVVVTRRPDISFYRHLTPALDADRPDVVHLAAEPWDLVPIQVARWARRNPRTAFFVQGDDRHWWDVGAFRRAVRRQGARSVVPHLDGYVGTSAEAVATAERFGLKPGAATGIAVTSPRDPKIFRPSANDEERREARQQFGLRLDGVGFGFLGRMVPEKGPFLFLDALRTLSASERVWGVIAGRGPVEEEVERRCREQGVAFLGPIGTEGVADFYRSIDVLVVPSYRIPGWDEQGARVLSEGMLSGCRIIGARSGAIPEMISEFGFLVEERDAGSLADAMARSLAEPYTPALARAARQQAIERYSGEGVARTLVDLWGRALTRQAA